MCSGAKNIRIKFWFILLLIAGEFVRCINITLAPKELRCFTSYASKGDKIIGSVGVVPADSMAEVNLYKVESNLIHNQRDNPIPSLDFSNLNFNVLENSFYSLCVTNHHSDYVTFVISFRVETISNKGMSSLSTVEDLKGVITYAERLLTSTREIMERMEAYSTREYLLSKIINKMNSRIITWSIVQMIVVIGLCCYQIYHISSFFEVKSFV
ncbi:emp24/gp25L/p24 family/GOLD family protein [Theileria parva strain Muguga]|uniref:Cop-coated vesicle membrane protein p24, putative n=1 Tax=Theileria parva TaxID=5875 RepID=Q4N6H5_THEPA|nr:emp24/gp25L/p24 family/GOLD family protein [Theileria parva strain Muguga]EAN34433.1 emp24/gp25L/p24 family/GOLD family protein [Theileria parva strain Muguga]|eukprot:XP_766716.1 cop-coated vesicle membrane protein p24 precursor [Theileria parva strain Muguga]